MLPRILEPEVMDTPEEARDYDAMDHSTVNRVFATDFLKVWPGHLPVLDVGTGTAQIPIEVCRQATAAGTAIGIHGIDLAEEMLLVGRENVRRQGLRNQIDLSCCDAKTMPFADEAFGAVISNSIVHHIPEPARVFVEMVRVVIRGGLLFVRDLLRPPDQATLDRLVRLYAGEANEHQRQMFADSLRAALTLEEVRGLVVPLGFAAATVQQTSDRHWTWSAMKP
jgi:ubiquinone/menaquinone biosynthesis C-methylase UbiE